MSNLFYRHPLFDDYRRNNRSNLHLEAYSHDSSFLLAVKSNQDLDKCDRDELLF